MENNPTSSKTTPSKRNAKPINERSQFEHMLLNTVLITEMAMDLKERCGVGEKYICYLRSLAIRGSKTISTLQCLTKSFLLLAQKWITTATSRIENMAVEDQICIAMKLEYEKLLSVIEKELSEIDDTESVEHPYGSLNNIAEKIKLLEMRQKPSPEGNHLPPSSSAKSFKSDIDEKYPENLSRESLIDLNNVMNLPSVPEDIFGYATKPTRTSSLSSLKSMRKVKLYLQRASSASDEEDENSEPEEHDVSKLVVVVSQSLLYLSRYVPT